MYKIVRESDGYYVEKDCDGKRTAVDALRTAAERNEATADLLEEYRENSRADWCRELARNQRRLAQEISDWDSEKLFPVV